MKLYIMDAFTATRFGGNPAGVALAEGGFPPEELMRRLAAELRYSETAFVKPEAEGFRLRFFTPVEEVELCGHATIAAFTALRLSGWKPGRYPAWTKAGRLQVDIEPDRVWMDMAPPKALGGFQEGEAGELYASLGLTIADRYPGLKPEIISTGLPDILLPVTEGALHRMRPDFPAIASLSRRHRVTGIHAFAPAEGGVAARCRNFAPLYGIDEEAATGTSTGALTYLLFRQGRLRPGETHRFLQGEDMGRPSELFSRLTEEGGGVRIRVGGGAVMLLEGEAVL